MRKIILCRVSGLLLFIYFSTDLYSQSGINTGINGMVINLPCNQNCITDPFRIPHIKSTSDYTFSIIPYNPYAFTSTTGSEDPNLYLDDTYSFAINLPFQFCFYDSVYPQAVVGSNGLITFDITNASCENGYRIEQPIPYNLGVQCSQFDLYYPKAAIMADYSDLDPTSPASDVADRKIQWWAEGTAPFRRFIISYYRIGSFGNTSCTPNRNTFQIVLYESTGIIEVYAETITCPSTITNSGRSILGIQNWARDKAVAAPGKNNTTWSETNTAYRFTPSGGATRFVSSEILTLAGNFIANADTTTTTAGLLDLSFPGFCPSGTSDQYIIRTTYASCDNGAPLMVDDTITINKTNSLNATASVTPTSCAPVGTGTATIDIPAGIGTAPYTFVLNPGGTSQTGNNLFSGLSAGNYNVTVTDASGGCSSVVPVTIVNTGTLNVTYTVANTSCVGAPNGSITVDPPVGTPPVTYSINNGPFGSNNVFSNLAPGNYQIKVQDNAGCQATLSPVVVAAGSSITMTTSTTPTSCPGANNGSITITGSSGTAPFQYSINGGNYQTNPTFSGLAPGTYFLSMKDAVGCTVTFQQATVVQGTGTLSGTGTATPTSCSGATNGSITVTPTSGSGPYEYTIDNGTNWQTSPTFNGLAAGNYTVKIREGGVCTSANISVTVNTGAVLTGTAVSTPTACAGVNNGSITVTAGAAFTGPFEYALNGGSFQTSNSFTGVAAGNHNVVIRNAAGCVSGNIPVTVTAGTVLTGTVVSNNTSCNGASDGTITATATNGSGPYQYSLDGGPNQASNIFSGISAGTHNIIITDNFGCISAQLPVTVTAGTVLTGTASSSPTACTGVNNGSITVTAGAGFTGPFEYALDGGGFQSSNSFTGVSAGNHNIVIRNTAGCVSGNIPVNVATGSVLTGTVSASNTSCNGASDGTITATATNGSGPYQYSLDGGSGQASNVFTGVAAGAHNVVITDNFGCISAQIPVIVNAGSILTGTATSISTACAGVNNGSVTVTATGGFTGPFEYALDGGVFQTSNSFTGVAAGSHNVIIRNGAGCTSGNISVAVAAGTSLMGTAVTTAVSCNGAADGVITVTPGSGSAPYQYSLDGGASQLSNVFTNLVAGPHNIIITDAFGCTSAQIPVTITQPAPLSAPPPVTTKVICNGANNGSITINPSGGTLPYTYSLDNTNFQPSNVFSVPQGSYTVYVKDSKGCSIQFNSVNITEPPPITGSIVSTTGSSCNGGNDGIIEVTASGGTGPYQYSINGATFQSSNILNVAAGSYTVTIKDANNCLLNLSPVVISLTDNLSLTVVNPAPICEGSSVQLQVTSNATNYTWTGGAGGDFSSTTVPDPVVSPDVSTTYTITATLGSCTKTEQVAVNVIPAPIPDAGTPGNICFGQDYQLQASGGITYLWSPSTYLDDAAIANPRVIKPGKTITYTLSVKDANGCPSLVTDDVTVSVTPPIQVFTSPIDTVVYAGDQFSLFAAIPGTDTSYTWSPSIGLSDPNISSPAVTALNAGDIMTYKVTVTTSAGCQGEAYVTVKVYEGPELYVATAFTPNGDGKNDVFIPFPVGIKELKYFRVFNRWGQQLYFTKTLNQGWDGTVNGAEQGSGVYIWMAEAITENGVIIKKKGTITLIR